MAQMKKWFRFSLRTMLVLIAALCIWLGFQVNAAHRQREAVAAILNAGGRVYYDYQLPPVPLVAGDSKYKCDLRRTPPGPNWLRQSLGDDYFRTAIFVHLLGQNL